MTAGAGLDAKESESAYRAGGMRIGFVFTNYNNSSFTWEAVRSLVSSPLWYGHKIVVVDNDSTPEDVDSLRLLQKQWPEVEVIFNAKNIGYFKGLNIGIARLRESRPDITCMVIGNNDLVFPDGFIGEIGALQGLFNKYAVICPDLLTLDGVHQNPHVKNGISKFRRRIWDLYYSSYAMALLIKRLARWTGRWTKRRDYAAHDEPQEIYMGYGACYILGPLFFSHYEQLRAPVFLMGEEFFLSRQLEEKGQTLFYEPSILVRHHDHATISKVPSRKMWEISRESYTLYRDNIRILDDGKR